MVFISGVASFFSPGGQGGGVRHFSGGQDPQKVIGFDNFVQENVNFFLISLKVRGARYFRGGGQPQAPVWLRHWYL